MSVSDDSKVKLIETKNEILFAFCKQIKMKPFQRSLALSQLKAKNPEIYALIEKYDNKSVKTVFSEEEIEIQLSEDIKTKAIDVLQLICGEDINTGELSDSEIQALFRSKLNELAIDLNEIEVLNKIFDNKFENYQKSFNEYLEKVKKYYNKYKIPFELTYDEMNCNLLMGKAQTLIVRNRLCETKSIHQLYGNEEKIQSLREERKQLEKQEIDIKRELKKSETLLTEYESLPKDLLKEYRSLKNDLECREWAINELNKSSSSTTNGSVLSD